MSYTVYIEFTKPEGKILPLFSWVIRLVQGTKYSHVRLRWFNTVGKELIYEASGTSVKLTGDRAAKNLKSKVLKRYSLDLTRDEYRRLISLLEFSGVDYGIWQAVGIGLSNMFGLRENLLSRGRDKQVCSELVEVFLRRVKDWGIRMSADMAGPKEIDKWLEKLCKRRPKEITLELDLTS